MHEPAQGDPRTFFEWSVDDHTEVPARSVAERAARHGWHGDDATPETLTRTSTRAA